jgi:hypothetical protein
MARRTADAKEPLASRDVIHAALGSLKANGALNLTARVLLMLFALCAAVLAVVLIYIRADKMVEVLTDQKRTEQLGEQLIALTAPVLVLMILAGLAVIIGFLAHSRGLDESIRTLDSVNRLRRENEVAVSARGLIVAFEEQLSSIKRSHSVVLWVVRTLFIVTLGLFSACAIRTIAEGVDPTTAVLGGTSLAGALLGAATRIPDRVAHETANIVQIQLIVTGAHRQISMLESDAFASMNNRKTSRSAAHEMVLRVQDRIEHVIDTAVKQIEKFADPQPEADVIQFRRPSAA